MKNCKKKIWMAALCIYVMTVAYLCFMRPDDIPQIRPDLWGIPIDKAVHFLMFFPYPVLAYAAFRPTGKRRFIHLLVLLAVMVSGAVLAIGTEFIQGLSEYRSYEISDFYADMLGIACSSIMTAAYILTVKTEN